MQKNRDIEKIGVAELKLEEYKQKNISENKNSKNEENTYSREVEIYSNTITTRNQYYWSILRI